MFSLMGKGSGMTSERCALSWPFGLDGVGSQSARKEESLKVSKRHLDGPMSLRHSRPKVVLWWPIVNFIRVTGMAARCGFPRAEQG